MRTPAYIPHTTGVLLLCLLPAVFSPPAQQPDARTPGRLQTSDGIRLVAEPILTGLEVPWSMAFSDSDLYFTERPGRLSVLRRMHNPPVALSGLTGVHAQGEGGLMGLALDPSFTSTGRLYVSYTYETADDIVLNKVVRFTLRGNALTDERVILDRIPGGGVHNGCRLAFGPDGKLYITTGDAARRALGQDTASLGGKVLRVNSDGTVPADNPFQGSPVYSLGHRNPQGIAWNPETGVLFASEHGPSGFDGPGGGDEINVIRPGLNYGWPIIHHTETRVGLQSPLLEFTPAIAPSGIAFSSGRKIPGFKQDLLVAALRGEHLLRIRFRPGRPGIVAEKEKLFQGEFGRLRDVVEGPDGWIYFCTSNRDGRGSVRENDDKIFRLRSY